MVGESGTPVVIITGAGRGLGREHALALAQAGYAVVVNDLGGAGDGTGADQTPAQSVVEEIKALGGQAIADGTDVADWAAAGAMVEKAVKTFGRLDGLVNNAGILRDRMLINMTEQDWDLSIRVNLKGTAAPLHHAMRYWRDLSKQSGGPVKAAVVNTSSASGLYAAVGQANYASAKSAVATLTLVAAREMERYGVRVNAIAPVAATRLTESVMPEGVRNKFAPAAVSPLVVYLLSEASASVTGRVFEVGGGALSAVDMWRPVAGRRASGGLTPDFLEAVSPALMAEVPANVTSADAMAFLAALPDVQEG